MTRDHVRGKDDRDGRAQSSHRAAQFVDGKAGHSRQGDDRHADGSKRDGRGIGQQAQGGGIVWRESQSHHHGPGTATGVPKPAAPSRKAPKPKAMMMAWIRKSGVRRSNGILDDGEFAGRHRHVVEHDGPEHDPGNREKPECRAVCRRTQRKRNRHAISGQGHQPRSLPGPTRRPPMRAFA